MLSTSSSISTMFVSSFIHFSMQSVICFFIPSFLCYFLCPFICSSFLCSFMRLLTHSFVFFQSSIDSLTHSYINFYFSLVNSFLLPFFLPSFLPSFILHLFLLLMYLFICTWHPFIYFYACLFVHYSSSFLLDAMATEEWKKEVQKHEQYIKDLEEKFKSKCEAMEVLNWSPYETVKKQQALFPFRAFRFSEVEPKETVRI